jgi:hypothetical protein
VQCSESAAIGTDESRRSAARSDRARARGLDAHCNYTCLDSHIEQNLSFVAVESGVGFGNLELMCPNGGIASDFMHRDLAAASVSEAHPVIKVLAILHHSILSE